MRVAVIGYGVEGRSAAKYWQAQGADITVRDQHPLTELAPGATVVTGPEYLEGLDDYDLVVRTASVKPWLIKTKAPVTTVVKEFMAKCPARIVGVTGTKGKGTTATLIARILGEAAWRTWLGGNIGISPLDFLSKVRANHIVVLELSSFQLMDLDVSPHIAVALMITPEHLDWHRNAREYISAKGNIFWHQRPDDMAIYNAGNDYSTQIAQLSPGTKRPYMAAPGARVEGDQIVIEDTVICRTDEVALVGAHNLENVCAAATATWDLVAQNPAPIARATKAFTGLEHRLELVREVKGVRYYDDSISTVPDTAIAAIKAFPEPKIVILGGSDKKSDFTALGPAVARGNVRYAVLVGEMAPAIKAALEAAGVRKIVIGPQRMTDLVSTIQSLAEPGDVVLLSPACPSYDQYRDFSDRGDQFKAAVRGIR
jgi:UDP-N-acetylmuramoylalanine--D-glutamate ligase